MRSLKNNRLQVEYVRDLRKAVKPLADGSNRIVKIAPKYLDAWAEIERVCRKRFGSSSTLAAINKLTSEVAERFDIRIHFVDAMDLNSFWAKLKECEATDVHETETRGGAADDDNVATRASSDVVESQTAGQITVTPVDDGGLAKYQDGQTPLGKRIVKALMSRKHFVKFATLRSEAWEGSEVEDSTIRRRLQDVEKRLTANGNHDVDIEISPVSIEAKWVWLNPQKGDKKGAN